MKRMTGALAALAVLMLAAVPGLAEEKRQVEGRVDARSDGIVTVENIAGRIEIVGWDKDEVAYEGHVTGDVQEVVLEGGRKTTLKVRYPRKAKHIEGGAWLVVHVPRASRLAVECISADIEVRDLTGVVEAEAISGDVTVKADCEEVEAESISGDVDVTTQAREVSVGSISGGVKAAGGTAEIEAETVSGSIELAFDRFLSLDVESVSGDADVSGDLDDNGEFDFELHSGTLTLAVPGDVSAEFRVETFSGGIDNGFGQKSRKTSKYTPGRELEFTNNGGSARVRIDTFSGDVIIRKR